MVADLAGLVKDGALVKVDAVMSQRLDQTLGRTGNLTLCVGVLNSQIEYAAALVRQTLTNRGGEQAAEMHKACGAGRETGDLCALGELTRGICCLNIGRCLGDLREQQIG